VFLSGTDSEAEGRCRVLKKDNLLPWLIDNGFNAIPDKELPELPQVLSAARLMQPQKYLIDDRFRFSNRAGRHHGISMSFRISRFGRAKATPPPEFRSTLHCWTTDRSFRHRSAHYCSLPHGPWPHPSQRRADRGPIHGEG